jgi:K+-sensing histidine kinase KdpD
MMADMRPANRKVNARALGTDALPKCTIAAPLTVGDQKYGVLVLETLKSQAEFELTDLPFVQTIADLIALAIDRARLEAKADAIRSARQADRLRSEVMATLSHQLRMPLSAIKGYATALMLDEIQWSDAKRKEFLQLVDEETDSMQAMIKELLDSSLIDVGQMSLELQPIRIPYMARDISADFQRRYERHRIIIDFPPDFPILDIDPRWMKQVFRNVLDNAIKYSPEGGLIVLRGEIRQNVVVIGVSDQGIGISPEDLIPLFERYYRGRSHNGFRVPGTGLGLPVARAIVEAHGGRIWAESKVGQGTTIYFSIPRPIIDLAVEE